MGERFVADHLRGVAGCAERAARLVEEHRADVLAWMRGAEECRVGPDGQLVKQRSAAAEQDYDYLENLEYDYYEDYLIPVAEDDLLQYEDIQGGSSIDYLLAPVLA